jgi:hypothetical protein
MQCRAPACDGAIDRKYLLFEGLEHALLEPITQPSALLRVAPFHQENAALKLEHRDDREIQLRLVRRLRPRPDVDVSAAAIAELGPDMRIDQIHQSRSTGRKIRSPMRGGSKSMSSS